MGDHVDIQAEAGKGCGPRGTLPSHLHPTRPAGLVREPFGLVREPLAWGAWIWTRGRWESVGCSDSMADARKMLKTRRQGHYGMVLPRGVDPAEPGARFKAALVLQDAN